jgi:hypothetical protein
MALELERMKAKFNPVFREMRALRRKIHQQEGWIFVEHRYTQEELLESEHHRKIYSYTDKIGDDIEHWYREGRLSEREEEAYYLLRDRVEEELEEINDEIARREPTWWESFQDAAASFVRSVMENLPEVLRRPLLEGIGSLIRSLGWGGKSRKLLR